MKLEIHPQYVESKVSCACGHKFITYSTKPIIKLEICSNCHPFFTGKQKLLDSAGRVERFMKKFKEIKVVTKRQKKVKAIKPKKTKPIKVLTTAPSTPPRAFH